MLSLKLIHRRHKKKKIPYGREKGGGRGGKKSYPMDAELVLTSVEAERREGASVRRAHAEGKYTIQTWMFFFLIKSGLLIIYVLI